MIIEYLQAVKDILNCDNESELKNLVIEQINELTTDKYFDESNYLSEKDFFPPSDNRILHSGISDISDGDNFEDYCKYFFDNYEEDLF